MDKHDSHILLIGAGKMGGALLASWVAAGRAPSSITVLEKPDAKIAAAGVNVITSLDAFSGNADCILLAVKPQSMDALVQELKQKVGAGTKPLYLSIAAGKTLEYFHKNLGGNKPIIRAMPNTPAIIGKGITAICANALANTQDKKFAEDLLRGAGEVIEIEESQMDIVTAISGSGPAYVFLFMEALIEAGVRNGLSEEVSTKLVKQTVLGSAALACASSESVSQLRQNVTSPNGTTAAALEVLMESDGFKTLLESAVNQARKRSKELA